MISLQILVHWSGVHSEWVLRTCWLCWSFTLVPEVGSRAKDARAHCGMVGGVKRLKLDGMGSSETRFN